MSSVAEPLVAPALPDVRVSAALWVRLAPIAVGILAAAVCLWNLAVSGYANTYYSAAAQAAGQSWSAMFFGSIDAANFITIDKPPVSLWVMGLSVRLLGLSPLAVLLPEALAGIASVLLLQATVRRSFGPVAALVAGIAFALTPVAALMFRYNNPDAVLTLLLVAGAWALVRGLEDDRLRWPILAAVLVGFAFLTKYLQAYLVLPAFAITYLVAARGDVRRRLIGLVAAGVAVVVSSFWWVAIVDLLPAASRPYIGGSTNNTAMDLILGYDGLGRIFGNGSGAPGGGGVPGAGGGVPGGFGVPGASGGVVPDGFGVPGAGGGVPGGFSGPGASGGGPGSGFGGAAGLLRMFNTQWAGQISWLLPPAAVGLVVGLLVRVRAPRTDPRRAGFLLWGLWGLTHVLVFSLMTGIVHSYYAVVIAPAAAALFGGGVVELWRLRERYVWGGLLFGAVLVGTAAWAWQVLERTPAFFPGAGIWALTIASVAAVALAVPPIAGNIAAARIARVAAALAIAAVLVGPALYTADTVGTALAGGDPSAGPAAATANRGFPGGSGGSPFPGGAGGFGGAGGLGGFAGDAAGTSTVLLDYLLANRGDSDWLVAVSSANQAGPLQLASGAPVMAMGGFMGSDPAPTTEQLRAYVRDGRLRYVMLDGSGGGPGGFFGGDGFGSVASARNDWVSSACTKVELDGITGNLYDCTGAG